jgi:hypothetical protein
MAASASMFTEETILALPSARQQVPLASQFRSTWLASSIRAIRDRHLLDTYLRHLPAQHHAPILESVAGVWLPIEVAMAHYEACDRLGIGPNELIEIGLDTARQVHHTILHTAVRLAKGAGVTPWTILPQVGRLWERIWVGGGVGVTKMGPKDARIEIAGWPCARYGYIRLALRGVILGIVELFCAKAFTREMTRLCTPTSLAYTVSWA